MEPKNKTEPVATVKSLRKQIGEPKDVFLPSGIKVTLKHLTPLDYIKRGFKDIPNDFFRFVNDLSEGKVDTNTEGAEKNLKLYEKFLNITLEEGMISPPVVLVYAEGKEETHMLFGEFSQQDQKYIVDVISGRLDG